MTKSVAAHDLDLERGILGQLLMWGDLVAEFIAAGLTVPDFYRHVHQLVFRAVLRLHAQGVTPSTMLVGPELGKDLSEVGRPYLMALSDGVAKPAPANIRDAVRRLAELRVRREMAGLLRAEVGATGAPDWTPERMHLHISAVEALLHTTTTTSRSFEPFMTARQMASATASEIPWIAKPYLIAHGITLLTGKPKTAGKTTLTMDLVRALVTGDSFLGEPVQKNAVIYLSEQSRASLNPAIRRAGLSHSDDLHIASRWEMSHFNWPAIVNCAVNAAQRENAGVLVVDTFPQFAGLTGDEENSSGAMLAALGPLQLAAAKNSLAIWIVGHDRKAGGHVGDSARGSNALTGGVDIVLSLHRPEGRQRNTVRTLSALSRFDETPNDLVIEKTANGFVSLGDETALASVDAERALLARLPTTSESAVPQETLVESVGPEVKKSVALGAIAKMIGTGQIRRAGRGGKGHPYMLWRPPRPMEQPSVEPVATQRA